MTPHVAPYAVGLRVLHERTGPSMYRLSTGVDQLLRRVVWRRRHSTDSWPRRSSTFERPNRARRCTSPTAYKTPPVAGCLRNLHRPPRPRGPRRNSARPEFPNRARSLRLAIRVASVTPTGGRTRPAGFQSRPEVVTCRESALPATGHDHGRVASPALPNLRQLLSWPAPLGRTTSSKDIELRVLRRAGHRAGPGLAPSCSRRHSARDPSRRWRRSGGGGDPLVAAAVNQQPGIAAPSRQAGLRPVQPHTIRWGRAVGMLPRPRRCG